jgi:site-specific DNA recombinase
MAQRHMPIGYKLVDGKIQIDDPKADAVKRIFRDYAAGASLLVIVKELSAEGFLNANNQQHWYHATVSRILDNVKYQGNDFYPGLIEKDLFEKVKNRRNEQCEKLGRNLQLNSMSCQYVFSGILHCGECGDVYRKYVEHSGKLTKRIFWKCKRYIYQNRVCCCNSFLTDEQIESAFLSAANRILTRKQYLDYIPKKKHDKYNPAFVKLDREIKELEEEGRYSSKELPALLFERQKPFIKWRGWMIIPTMPRK